MKYLTAMILLTGCCAIQFPLDGKAQSWCQARKKAERLCAAHGGILSGQYTPYSATCSDGTVKELRK